MDMNAFDLGCSLKRAVQLFGSRVWEANVIPSAHSEECCVMKLDIEPKEQRYMASGGSNGQICIHDTTELPSTGDYNQLPIYSSPMIPSRNTGIPTRTQHLQYHREHILTDLTWCPYDDGILSTCGLDGQVNIWDMRHINNSIMGRSRIAFTFLLEYSAMCQIFYASSAQTLAVGCKSPQLVRICDLRSGTNIQGIYMSSGMKASLSVLCIIESCKPTELVIGCSDGTIRAWDTRSGAMLLSDKGILLQLDKGEAIMGLCLSSDKLSCLYYTDKGSVGRCYLYPYMGKQRQTELFQLKSQPINSRMAFCLMELSNREVSSCIAVSDQNEILILGAKGRDNLSCISTLNQHWDQVSCVKWSMQTMVIH